MFVPAGSKRAEVAPVVGRRWTIEEAPAEANGEVGFGEYEVRSWTGWYRHITLALVAHTFLAAIRARTGQRPKWEALTTAGILTAFKRGRGLAG